MATQIRPFRPSRFSAFKAIILCLLAGAACISFVGCGSDTESSTSPIGEITSSSSDEVIESSDGYAFLLTSSSEQGSSSSITPNESSSSVQSSSSEVAAVSSSSDVVAESSSSDKVESSSSEKSSSSVAESSSSVESSSSEEPSSSSVVETSSSVAESSSSLEIESSSSIALSSSSETPTVKSIYDAENNTLTDLRDNKVYKTVTIGAQVWMAENLNYKYEAGSKSYCYNDSTEYCNLYGRLYTEDVRDFLCPEEWHLPDSLEWEILIQAADKKNGPLKAYSSWVDETQYGHPESMGTNETGFSALGGGYRSDSGHYTSMGHTAAFWVAKAKRSFKIGLYNPNSPYFSGLSTIGNPQAYSVRCIKDN